MIPILIDGDQLTADVCEDLLVRGLHQLPRPDGADFPVVGDVRAFSAEVKVGATAIRGGRDQLAGPGIAHPGLEAADGNFRKL